jgi:pimeloyl-ACP methyl ester carboxylesterase
MCCDEVLRFFVGGLLWVFLKARLRRLLSGKKASGIADMLGEGVTLAAADEAWGKLMQITIEESARPNLVTPEVFTAKDFAALQSSVLLLIGEKEILYKPEPVIALAKKLIPGLQGAIIGGAHHLANLACPEKVNQLVLAFMANKKLDR